MYFLVLFLPLGVATIVTGLRLDYADRALFNLIRHRYPAVLDIARGRPTRWFDAFEEFRLGERGFRERLLKSLGTYAAVDADLRAALDENVRARKAMKKAVLWGTGLSFGLVLLVRVLPG